MRFTAMSITSMPGRSSRSTCLASRIAPAQVPQTGRPLRAEVAQRGLEAVGEDEPGDGSAFAAGDDERVEALKLLDLPHLHDLMADPFEHLAVFAKIALQREHANALRLGGHSRYSSEGATITGDELEWVRRSKWRKRHNCKRRSIHVRLRQV